MSSSRLPTPPFQKIAVWRQIITREGEAPRVSLVVFREDSPVLIRASADTVIDVPAAVNALERDGWILWQVFQTPGTDNDHFSGNVQGRKCDLRLTAVLLFRPATTTFGGYR